MGHAMEAGPERFFAITFGDRFPATQTSRPAGGNIASEIDPEFGHHGASSPGSSLPMEKEK